MPTVPNQKEIHKMRKSTCRLAAIAVGLCALAVPSAASATATEEEIANAISGGVTYIKSFQQADGSIPGFGGDWSLTSLAAAGTAAANVKKTAESTDARTWYQGVVGSATFGGEKPPATEFERGALLAYAAGIDPARPSKRQNLIARVASFYQTASPGYYGTVFNETVFGLLALARTKTTTGVQRVPQVVLNEAIEAVRANQHTDGGWTFSKVAGNKEAEESKSEPDMTGAAMAALCSAGVANTDEAIVEGREYLESILVNATGAFESAFGVNADSNAWGVQGLNACGIGAQSGGFVTAMGKTPIDFLISLKIAGSGFKYQPASKTAELNASQDAVRALAGAGFTATPPVPTGGLPQWKAETEFGTKVSETAPLMLVVDKGSAPLKVCMVSIAPGATTTTLSAVLDAAVKATTPAECVTGYLPASGTGAITQINGFPGSPEAKWNIVIDGGESKQAKRNTTIHLGDTIYLKWN
jgi:hypothetical protein